MKKWLEQYFTFSRSEKNGIIFLVILSTVAFVFPSLYFYFRPVKEAPSSSYDRGVEEFIKEFQEKKMLTETDTTENEPEGFNPYVNVDLGPNFSGKKEKKIEYFEFDPNKIGVADWMRLGFSEKQAQVIENLKSKGAKFYKPEDLKRVFVISEENYNRLYSFIRIDTTNFPKKVFVKTTYPEKVKEKYVVDINTADSSLFERQRGIGPSLANRIVRYRERLGGFVSPEQIKEVWGMPDSTYQFLKERFIVNNDSVSKINLNSSDFEALKKHPYINYTYAKIITAYRKQHGNFAAKEDLKRIPVINDSIYRKLSPYIYVE